MNAELKDFTKYPVDKENSLTGIDKAENVIRIKKNQVVLLKTDI